MSSTPNSVTVSNVMVAKEKFCGENLVLTYTIHYPEFSSSCYSKNIRIINHFYRQKADRLMYRIHHFMIKSAIENCQQSATDNNSIIPYEIVSNYEVTENSGNLLSLYTDCYQFTGGAHGGTIRSSETWNLSSGCRMSLAEICTSSFSKLLIAIKAEIKKQIAKQSDNFFENYDELVEQTFNPSQFYIQNGKIVIYFQQYDIAPYVTGIPTFVIPSEICKICQ